jgi:hypothetical protein
METTKSITRERHMVEEDKENDILVFSFFLSSVRICFAK